MDFFQIPDRLSRFYTRIQFFDPSTVSRNSCAHALVVWWVWEIVAAIISMSAAIALIVILRDADQQQQRPWFIGNTQLTLNTTIAIISTILRTTLLVMVSGALNQGTWNWFAREQNKVHPGRPLKDLNIFGGAANSTLASLKLLYRTRLRSALSELSLMILALTVAVDTLFLWVLA